MYCKGICTRYKATKKGSKFTMGFYGLGFKRCQICELFIDWEGKRCPCCSYKLRTKPRNMTTKNKLRITKPEAF